MAKFMTPVGEVLFANLHKASTKYKRGGEYSCTILVDPTTTEFNVFREEIEALEQEYRTKRGTSDEVPTNWPWQEDVNWETKEPNGLMRIRGKMPATQKKAEGSKPEPIRIMFLDKDTKPLQLDAEVGRGSTLRFGGTVGVYHVEAQNKVFVTLKFRGVQVIDLVEQGSGYDPTLSQDLDVDAFDFTAVGASEASDPFEEN